MPKTRIFRVINNRAMFRCAHCAARRNIPVPLHLRNKNIRCHKCLELTRCQFNRRLKHREQRGGRVILTTNSGEELTANLHDLSDVGFGIDIPPGFTITSKVRLGDKVRLKCSWNSNLADSGYLKVRNIQGRRIGLIKTDI